MIRRMNTGFGNSSELRIFIVDDNANHSTGIKQLLEIQSGYSVVGIATNGDEALKRLEHTECDVVLMDMTGRVVFNQETTIVNGLNIIPIQISLWQAGIYQVILKSAEGTSQKTLMIAH